MNPTEVWHETWAHLGKTSPDGLLDSLVQAYREPHRAYHTLAHLEECFGHLERYPGRPHAPGFVLLALWFHDAIYDTRAPRNEEKSAAWARSALANLEPEPLDVVERLILVTKHDAHPATPDEELLLDLDLAILGSSPERFAEYEEQIRFEYSWVPEADYRKARAGVLRQFEDRPVLYHTPHFRELLEARARVNLAASLAALGSEN